MGDRDHQSLVIRVGKEGNMADWQGRVTSPARGGQQKAWCGQGAGEGHLPPTSPAEDSGQDWLLRAGWNCRPGACTRPGPLLCTFHGTHAPPPPRTSGNSFCHHCRVPQVEGGKNHSPSASCPVNVTAENLTKPTLFFQGGSGSWKDIGD